MTSVMKTPRKVIEKISLPLMFVTFVMAVLVFAVSPVLAAPDLCDAGTFCDQDGDDFIRDHPKCPSACGQTLDCDDNDGTVGECPGGNTNEPEVVLEVKFRDQTGDKFGSDLGDSNTGSSFYRDGVEPVSTQIGKFRFGLHVGVSGARNFYLDLSGCSAPPSVPEMSCSVLPALRPGGTTDESGFTTGASVFATSPDRAHYLTMINEEVKDVDFQLVFLDAGGNEWRIMFNPSKCPKDISGVNLATMAKVRKTEDSWVFEATDGYVACLQLREGGAGNWTFHGLYSLPFQIKAYLVTLP